MFTGAKMANRTGAKRKIDVFTVVCNVLSFLLPRYFGLLSLSYDFKAGRLIPSLPWLIVCNLSGILFIGIYPFAATAIVKNRALRDNEDNGIGRIMDVSQYVIWYVLSVSVYIRQMYFSKQQMHLMNRVISFYRECETLCEEKVQVGEFLYPFILRGIYSYCGYAILNSLILVYFFDDLSQVNFIYKIAYFVPNIAITTTTIRFHSGVMQLTICGRCINRAFSQCIERVNAAHNKSSAEFEQVCSLAMERFDLLTTYHEEWYKVARLMEKGLSLLMLFTVTNAFMNLTSTVGNFVYTLQCWSHANLIFL